MRVDSNPPLILRYFIYINSPKPLHMKKNVCWELEDAYVCPAVDCDRLNSNFLRVSELYIKMVYKYHLNLYSQL